MAKENIIIDYDREEDILSLVKEGRKSKFSMDLELPNGDFIIDYGFDGQIVGIEFFNASLYFPVLKQVSDISSLKAGMSIQYGSNWAQIAFSICPQNSQPIVSYVNAPYNKKLILAH